MVDYTGFRRAKEFIVQSTGRLVDDSEVSDVLFPFQRAITRWAVRKGRAAIFANTGLGKTLMQVEWARLTGGCGLIVAPLSVTSQTVREAKEKLGLKLHYTRNGKDLIDGINITNYEMLHEFDAAAFNWVVLDESSILKSSDGVTQVELTKMFADTPYKLCCTATPAPNSIGELGQHSEFLGHETANEMRAIFFINDLKNKDGVWRLKRYSVESFYKWLASWGIAVMRPSDIGFDDNGYDLPPINVQVHTVDSGYVPEGMLPGFWDNNLGLKGAREVRRSTLEDRVALTANLVNGSDEQWIVWAGLNDESDMLNKLINNSINVHGTMSIDDKRNGIDAFVRGDVKCLITKTKIAGFGINMQFAHNMAFCGMDYSWEAYYQAVRRMFRFGQKETVNVHVVMSNQDLSVWQTVQNKEKEAMKMTEELIAVSAIYADAEIKQTLIDNENYKTAEATGKNWELWLGDSVERMREIPDNSLDFSVFSPPFGTQTYTYSASTRDLGNSRNDGHFFDHFQFIIDELMRTIKPGRNIAVHVQQIPAFKHKDGYIGIKDFRGDVIRAFVDTGFIFYGEVTVDKNPQVQAIRTRTKGLAFAQKNKDSNYSRSAFADYVLIFQKFGENDVPVATDVTNEEWIEFAHPVWYDIKETDTLNVAMAKSDNSERHMCPLQLPLIARLVRLYSNKGELVFSPFAGIGSELYESVRLGRRGLGIELKWEYWNAAVKNLKNVESSLEQTTMF